MQIFSHMHKFPWFSSIFYKISWLLLWFFQIQKLPWFSHNFAMSRFCRKPVLPTSTVNQVGFHILSHVSHLFTDYCFTVGVGKTDFYAALKWTFFFPLLLPMLVSWPFMSVAISVFALNNIFHSLAIFCWILVRRSLFFKILTLYVCHTGFFAIQYISNRK